MVCVDVGICDGVWSFFFIYVFAMFTVRQARCVQPSDVRSPSGRPLSCGPFSLPYSTRGLFRLLLRVCILLSFHLTPTSGLLK